MNFSELIDGIRYFYFCRIFNWTRYFENRWTVPRHSIHDEHHPQDGESWIIWFRYFWRRFTMDFIHLYSHILRASTIDGISAIDASIMYYMLYKRHRSAMLLLALVSITRQRLPPYRICSQLYRTMSTNACKYIMRAVSGKDVRMFIEIRSPSQQNTKTTHATESECVWCIDARIVQNLHDYSSVWIGRHCAVCNSTYVWYLIYFPIHRAILAAWPPNRYICKWNKKKKIVESEWKNTHGTHGPHW